MREYRLFGHTLATDFAFETRLAPGTGVPTVTFTRAPTAPIASGWEHTAPAYASPNRTAAGESRLCLYRLETVDVLRFAGVADFYLWSERIICHSAGELADAVVEIHFLGTVMSFWLERQGLPTLHASAVIIGGSGVAFLSSNKGGKTSLAAAMIQAGCPLLTDDVLAVERYAGGFMGRPGYPQMRMWPEIAHHFLGRTADLALVHPELTKLRVPVGAGGMGDFCETAQPLSRIYLPDRGNDSTAKRPLEVRRLSRAQALIELVRHSFSARLVEGLGSQAQRLDFFADTVARVPVCRLVYPSGLNHLATIAEFVLQDAQRDSE